MPSDQHRTPRPGSGGTATVPVSLRVGKPLSPTQRALWTSQRRHPDAPVQNMALLTHIDGPVDPARLAEAFAAVVASSDALRTRITDHDGTPLVTADAEPQAPELVDIDRHEARAWAEKRVSSPIDLSVRGYDSVILCHIDGTVSWYLALHHVITDATASALVFEATAARYRGEAVELDSYGDWATSLDRPGDDTTARRRERALNHWRDRPPAPVPNRLYRPIGRPGPDAARLPIPLDAELLDAIEHRVGDDLRMLSPDLGWTALLMTVTAAHLHQVAGAETLALGLPVHNRSDASARNLIGPVMEVFPVDVTIEPDDTFRSLHRRTSRAILTTLGQAVPGTAPTGDHSAVINVIPRGAVGPFGSMPTSTDWIHTGAIDSSHLLRVQLTAYEGDRLRLAVDVNRAAADDDQLDRVPGHIHRLLGAMVDDPDRPIAVELLADDERDLIRSWESSPDLPTDDLPDGSLVSRLAAALADRPSPTLHHHERTWTGEELWRRVEGLARWLRARGVGIGDDVTRVGIELPRSADAVIAILAVLAAGGSFVPLDRRQPTARRADLARRAGCVLTLTELPADSRIPAPHETPLDRPDPEREAYLLFTSGSTGEPKGVPISHRGIDRYLRFAAANYLADHPSGPTGRDLVVPLFSSLNFDLTLTSLFLPLLEGGELVVIDDEGPAALSALAERRRINWCKATPSHLEVLARILPDDHRLATLVVGGEAFGAGLARRLLGLRENLAIFNEYGPTEAVVGCMIHRVDPARLGDQPEVPIGHPAPGVTLRVVGPGLQRLPIGAAGELLIASPGLTTGYLSGADGRPHQEGGTADTGPFVELDGQRFYRSGDLVRLADPDTAVYLGRIDDQVKVGGIRLEPTEVEEALVAHPTIAGAAVRLWSPRPTEPDQRCVRCGLASNTPGANIDHDGICQTCHDYDRVASQAGSWFRTLDDLAAKRVDARRRRTGDHDCLHLLSGGKDSTYALYRLVELGFRPYALTLDNGFISEGAKENVRRTVAELGIDHEFATSEVMNDIFRDSLERHSNVCHGCYKTIYTLATTRAAELGIPLIVTGLSRGQLFETRLIPAQFRAERFDPDAIDRAVLEARKAYHRIDDGPNRLLDTSVFASDDVFADVEYLDFYRYVDVELGDMLSFLENQAPWVRPADTGRSTNCLINAAGIHTHLQEQGYHNYAIPYAWDVRLGHKTRQEAIDELDDQLDLDEVGRLLGDVGYTPNPRRVLTAWVVPEHPDDGQPATIPSPAELRTFVATTLATHAVPSAFVAVDALPLTVNGKLDVDALPAPERTHRSSSAMTVEAETELEARVVAIWEAVLGTEPISIDDDFFALGGDSLAALEMVVAVGEATGIELADDAPFLHTTPRALAEVLAATDERAATDEPQTDRRPTPLGPWTDDAPPPLSTGEQAILFEQSRHRGSALYNVGRLFHVGGPVDGHKLVAAVRAVAARHIPLSWSYGSPRRHLRSDRAVSSDLRSGAVEPDGLESALSAAHRHPFDLEAGPLLRVVVQPVTDGTTAVLLVCHHVSGDADSFDRLWHQIDNELSGAPATIPAVDYPSFTRWQAERVEADIGLREPGTPSRWVRSGPAPAGPTVLAPDRPEPDGLHTRTATVAPSELRSRGGATGFALALASVVATLRRNLDGDRVSLATITSGRDHPMAEDLFGYFLNNLPVDVDCPLDLTLDELVARAGEASARNMSARAYPWARIVDERRRAGVALPPLEVLLTYEDLSPTRLAGAPVEQRVLHAGDAVADATFFVQIFDGGDRLSDGPRIDLSIEYRGSVLGGDQAARILDQLDATLTAIVRRPSMTVAAVVTTGPMSQLDGGPLESPDTLLAGIVDQADRHPDGPAVQCGEMELSWSELDRASVGLARRLQAAGIGSDDRVLIHLPRSTALVVAILGTLRAGAAYVPLDTSYPSDRIDLIVERAGAAATIVGPDPRPQGALARLPILIELSDRDIDGHGTDAETDARTDTGTGSGSRQRLDQASGDDTAYVIFTSGSTGRPRGVAVRHRHLAASTAARAAVYPEVPNRFLMVSSPAFDSSIVGLFWTLASGGTIVLPTERQAHDPDALASLLGDGEITHTLLVPTLYQAILERGRSRPGWPLRAIVAGEACPPALVELHRRLRPDTELTNEYGPTETSVWATAHHLDLDRAPLEGPVPIGRPIPGTWVAVVDAIGHPVPTGVAGELIIGGAGVVDGYLEDTDDIDGYLEDTDDLDDNEATTSRFGQDRRGRFFLTGDRAAVVDGVVRFLGRTDDQLNVGGARVEPEDIERVLGTDPAVAAAIVTATDPRPLGELIEATDPAMLGPAMERAGRASDPAADLDRRLREEGDRRHLRLVAHIEPTPGAVPSDTALRSLATDRLPTTSRPTLYAFHQSLPRTPNGKLDRTAASRLPVPGSVRPDGAGPLDPSPPPSDGKGHADSDAEQRLVADIRKLFASVLQTDDVGPEDSFFDLGGHSLLALELLATIEDHHGVEVSVASLYDRPTPVAVAGLLRRWGNDSADDQYRYLIPIQTSGDKAPIFGVHVLGRNCEFYRPLADHLGPTQPVYGLGLTDAAPSASDPADIAEVATLYADELERCRPSGPVSLAAVSAGSTVAFDLARRLRSRGREVALLVMFDAAGPDAEQLALTRSERLAAHARSLRHDPGRWAHNTGYRIKSRTERLVERAGVWGRRRLGLPMPDDLRIREFVEANYRSQQAYRYEPYDGHVVVFKAEDDPFLSRLATAGMGWARIMVGPFDVETVAGGHLSMLAEPYVAGLAQRLAARHGDAVEALAHGPSPTPVGHLDAGDEPIGLAQLEASLRRSLVTGRLPIEVGRLVERLDDLTPAARGLVQRTDATLRALSERSRQLARSAAGALDRSGIDTRIDPVPDRSPWVRASLRLLIDEEDATARLVERACTTLADLGFRPQRDPDLGRTDDQRPATDPWARLVATESSCTLIGTDDQTSRIDLVWRSGPPADHSQAARRRTGDAVSGADDLGVFLGTPPRLGRSVLALADPVPDDVVLDIGCGDGRILVEAAQHFGCRARGIEIDPELATEARRRVSAAGLDDRIEIVEGDGSVIDLSTGFGPATVVFLFLPPEQTSALLPAVLDRLDPGGRVVAHEQLVVEHPVEPERSRLVVDDGVTIAHLWTR